MRQLLLLALTASASGLASLFQPLARPLSKLNETRKNDTHTLSILGPAPRIIPEREQASGAELSRRERAEWQSRGAERTRATQSPDATRVSPGA